MILKKEVFTRLKISFQFYYDTYILTMRLVWQK
mgnify:CR=1 FL=1